jgi:hypothetical protein
MTKPQKYIVWTFIIINAIAISYFTVTAITPVIQYEYQEHIAS